MTNNRSVTIQLGIVCSQKFILRIKIKLKGDFVYGKIKSSSGNY